MQTGNREARKGGFAMIMVLCIGALFVALATALLFAASLLVANANRQLVEQEVCGMASTFSARLNTELMGYDTRESGKTTPFGKMADDYLHGTFYSRALEPITFDCEPDELSDVGGADSLSVTLTKRENEIDGLDAGQSIILGDHAEEELTLANNWDPIQDYFLDVSVTATLKDQSFTYTQSYVCNSHYELYYTIGTGTTAYTYNTATKQFESATGNKTIEQAKELGSVTQLRTPGEPKVIFANRAGEMDIGEANP